MAEVTIIPPAQVQTVAPAGGQTSQNPSQPSLPAGTLISGTIAGKDTAGNYLLKTPQGLFTLQSATPLTYNSDVTIRIGANLAGNTSARIVTVNGEPFAQFSAPQPTTSDSVSEALLPQPAEPAQPPLPPGTVRAVVIQAPPPQPDTPPPPAQGSNVLIRLTDATSGNQPQIESQPAAQTPVASPPASASAAEQPQQTAQNPQTALAPPAPAPQTTTATPAAIPPATAQAVETQLAPVQAVTQPPQSQAQQEPATPASPLYNVYARQAAAAPSASPAPATVNIPIPAQVVSTDENGTLTLQTARGNITVKTPATTELSLFTTGTSVILEQPPAAQGAASQPAGLTELASSWQSLKDILTQLITASPASANALLARLPQIGPDFTSTSTAFIAALLQNNPRKLLGNDVIEALRNSGRQDLIEKFTAETATLSGTFAGAQQKPVAGWQMLSLPFVYQEALQQARLFVKRDPAKKEKAAKGRAADTRFVLEVELSELGPLQMDGLVKKNDKATAFDLIIRSHGAFSHSAQKEITAIYVEAAELTGFKGSLSFHVTRDFPVKPMEEAAGEETHAITV